MIDRTSQLDTIRWSECPYCAETVSNDSVTCAYCAEPVPPRMQPARPARPVVQCEKCQGQMAKRVIARYGSALRGIGFVLGFGSFLVIGVVGFSVMSAIGNAQAVSHHMMAGIGGGMFLAACVVCVPILILGIALARDKRVWQCQTCGYQYERA